MNWKRWLLNRSHKTSRDACGLLVGKTASMSDHSAAVLRYLKEKDPQTAFLISGEWGSGKTYFLRSHKSAWEHETGKRILVVSVAGLRTREELDQAVFLASAPWLLKGHIQAASVFVKAALRFAKIETKDFNLDANLKSGDVAIVFEDVDRYFGDLRVLFGFVIDLVDQSSIHTILVAAEDRLLADSHFSDWKEKIVGSSLLIEPSTAAMFDVFIEEIPGELARERLSAHRDSLQAIIEEWGLRNLRALRFAIRQISSLVEGIGVEIERLNEHEKVLIGGIFLGSLEIRRSAASEKAVWRVFSHQGLSENAQALLAGVTIDPEDGSEETKFVSELIARYQSFEFSLFPGGLTFLQFFKTGKVVADGVLNAFQPLRGETAGKTEEESLREIFLRDYLLLTQAEFDGQYQSLLSDLENGRIHSMSTLARAYLSLRFFAEKRTIDRSPEQVKDVVVKAIEAAPAALVTDRDGGDDFWYLNGSDENAAAIEKAVERKRQEAIDHHTEIERSEMFMSVESASMTRLQEWRTKPLFLSNPEVMLEWLLGLSVASLQDVIRLFGSRTTLSDFSSRLAREKSFLGDLVPMIESHLPQGTGRLSLRDSQLLQLSKTMRRFAERLDA